MKTKLSPKTNSAIDALVDLRTQIDQIRAKTGYSNIEPRPPNGFTVNEYAEMYNLAIATAYDQLKKMVNTGALKRIYCAVPRTDGRVFTTQVYVPV